MGMYGYIKPQTKYSKSMIGHRVEGLNVPTIDNAVEPTAQGEFTNCTKCHGIDRATDLEPCKGTGFEPCQVCNGTGYTIYNQTKQVKCWLCGGQGEISCPTCQGSGEVGA